MILRKIINIVFCGIDIDLKVVGMISYICAGSILHGHRNTRYHEKILSNKKKSYNFVNFLKD